MKRILLLTAALILANSVAADSFRCGRKVIKQGDSSSELVKKCGKPVRKFSSKEAIDKQGRQSTVSVSNWVYERNRKKDIVVSVRSGTVIKIRVY